MADYTTVARVKADMPDSPLSSTFDTAYHSAIAEMITNASRLIDLEVGGWPNFFYPTTDSETRYFDGTGEKEVWIDPAVSISQVSVAESGGRAVTDYTDWVADTDYFTWPYNKTPIERLVVDNIAGNKGRFNRSNKAVKVTGIFGYSETPPEAIAQACKIQAVRWFARAKQMWQDASASAQMGELIYAQELDPDVKRLLMPYKIENMV